MQTSRESEDPRWVHGSALQSVGAWIWVVGLALLLHGGWAFWQSSVRTERDVRVVRGSGVERIRMDGDVYSQDQVVRILKRRPWWAALPYVLLALAMGLCASVASRKPLIAAIAALGVHGVGSVVVMARLERFDYTLLTSHIFLMLLLILGVRSAVGFVRTRAA